MAISLATHVIAGPCHCDIIQSHLLAACFARLLSLRHRPESLTGGMLCRLLSLRGVLCRGNLLAGLEIATSRRALLAMTIEWQSLSPPMSLPAHVIATSSRVTYWRHALPAYCHCDIVQSHLLEAYFARLLSLRGACFDLLSKSERSSHIVQNLLLE